MLNSKIKSVFQNNPILTMILGKNHHFDEHFHSYEWNVGKSGIGKRNITVLACVGNKHFNYPALITLYGIIGMEMGNYVCLASSTV